MEHEPASDELASRVLRLAEICALPSPDPADEHQRWEVYVEAIERPQAWAELRACLNVEPDEGVATSVVVRVLELVTPAERSVWTAAIREEGRPFVERRAAELALSEDPEPARTSDGGWDIDGWTNWLQLRAAERSEHLALLGYLAEHGRTRRIRHLSRERIRKLG